MPEQIPKLTQERINNAVKIVGEFPTLRTAFGNSTFIYGTAGKGSLIVRGLRNWAAKAHSRAADPADRLKRVIDRELALFDPGRRAEQYLAGGYQMMDLYYGQAGTTLHLKRIPAIAEFVHHAMGFKGTFSMNESGRESYMRTWKTNEEGWKATSPGDYGQTATKEMSRIIRYGIRTFGGTLIFEGREVYYGQVFDGNSPRVGDTDLEARELFPYCIPQGASSFKYGKGRLVFHWGGKEAVPTKMKFLTNWAWGGQGVMHSAANMTKKSFNAACLLPIWNNFQRVPKALSVFNEAELDKILQSMGYPPLKTW